MSEDHRLVIIGGGVAGLDLASHLAGKRAGGRRLAVTLVDRETAYVWKPMLHTVAAGTSDASIQQTEFAAQAMNRGFAFHLGEAMAIDRAARQVHLRALVAEGEQLLPERQIPYDTVVLAIGSRANDFGTRGVAEHCATIDSRTDAVAFNNRLRASLLKAAYDQRTLTVGIVGAGATGVELAAELVQVANLAQRYRAGEASGLRVVLIESGPRILGPFPERVAASAQAALVELGVEVRTGAKVASVEPDGFHLAGGELIAAELRVWAAGVKAPPLCDTLEGLERTRSGQVVVDATLRVPADPAIFALGDCASPRLPGLEGPVPTTAQAAHQQTLYLCRHLPALIGGEPAPPASYHDFGSLVSLGGYDAYGTLGRFGLFGGGFIQGRIAQLGHALLYRSYQARLHGVLKGSLLWLIDTLGRHVRPPVRLS